MNAYTEHCCPIYKTQPTKRPTFNTVGFYPEENKPMKRIVVLIALVLGLTALVSAGDKGKASQMTGTICDQKCVTQDAGKASCDTSCKEQSGEATFIDDQGKAWKVDNPDVCKGHMGKKVKVKCKKNEDQNSLQILSIYG